MFLLKHVFVIHDTYVMSIQMTMLKLLLRQVSTAATKAPDMGRVQQGHSLNGEKLMCEIL